MVLSARSQTASEPLSDFGTLGQGTTGVNGINVVNGLNISPNACAPTAVDNGLTFLQNYFAAPIFSQNVNSYATVNALATAMGTANNNYWVYQNNGNGQLGYVNANGGGVPNAYVGFTYVKTLLNVGGTAGQNIYSGTTTYVPTINPWQTTPGMAPVSYGQDFNPTASLLYNDLKAKDAVELGILWGNNQAGQIVPSGGGHFVTLQSITMNGNTGTMNIIDPWGASTLAGGPGTTATKVQLTYTVQNGVLAITGTFGKDADTITAAAAGFNTTPFVTAPGFAFGTLNGQTMSGLITLVYRFIKTFTH